jgi:hypothetical protein
VETSRYCTPLQRELSDEERLLLNFLLQREAPGRIAEVDSLKVIAKCGCGSCPTVLFGPAFDSAPVTEDHFILADYAGKSSTGSLVGVMLWANEHAITELEGYSIDGTEPVVWPAPLALRPWPDA